VFDRLRAHIGDLMKAAALAPGGVVRRALVPAAEEGPIRGLVLDLTRSRRELLAENVFLRHQLLVAARHVQRPKFRVADRLVLVGLASSFANWRNVLVLVQPATLLRWHRDFFRDLWFRCHFVFVVMHLQSRKILHAVTTREPTSAWLAQQLRELTPFGRGPKFLLRDHDAKFGRDFDAVATGAGTRLVRTPVLAPKANGYVERLIGSIRREYLDQLLVINEAHLQKTLDEYCGFFNRVRPHQGIGQRRPAIADQPALVASSAIASGAVVAYPVLGGLHHDYRLAA
jgi:transposase InsO family protein